MKIKGRIHQAVCQNCEMKLSYGLCFSLDLINGAQEQCELPPMDGFPHCEGKIKVSELVLILCAFY